MLSVVYLSVSPSVRQLSTCLFVRLYIFGVPVCLLVCWSVCTFFRCVRLSLVYLYVGRSVHSWCVRLSVGPSVHSWCVRLSVVYLSVGPSVHSWCVRHSLQVQDTFLQNLLNNHVMKCVQLG